MATLRRGLTDEPEMMSGGLAAAVNTPFSAENHSGSLCAMSVAEDTSNLTFVPLVSGNNMVLTGKQPEPAESGRRLFYAQASQDISENQLLSWFQQFGVVEQIESSNAAGVGHGYVTMGTSEQAAAAVLAVQQNPQAGCPVQFLNYSSPVAVTVEDAAGCNAQSGLAANADRTLFFAKVPPTALASEVELLFGSFGKLAEVNLFRAWAGAKHSKGCGLITYVDRSSAAKAIAQLHGKYIFPGSDCPMVVEWMDMKKQRPVAPAQADKPPLGCSHDAYKLLLGNIPLGVSEAELVSILCQFGHVVQIGALTPETALSTSSHVWFATKQSADALQAYAKTKPIWLRDPRTQQELALSVKKAKRSTNTQSGSLPSRSVVSPAASNVTMSGINVTASSNSSSSTLLPMLRMGSLNDYSNQLAQLQAGQRAMAAQGAVDVNMLNPDVMKLLPMQQQVTLGGFSASQVAGNFMTADACDTMLDNMMDASNMSGVGLPVQLQPAVAAQQLASNMGMQNVQQRVVNSQMCLVPRTMLQQVSGQHCQSSPANIPGVDDFEGSFNMSLMRGMSGSMQTNQHRAQNKIWSQQQQQQQLLPMAMSQPLAQVGQQPMLLAANSGLQVLPPQQQQQQQQQVVAKQAISTLDVAGNGIKSIAVPIDASEVGSLAQHLVLFSNHSGAQVTITSLPGSSLAIMITGRADQVAMAQSLLAAARGQQ